MFGYLMLIAGDTEESRPRAASRIRSQIAFYASSPMYRDVLDAIGCADLQSDLETVVKQGRWDELPGLVDDDVLDHFALRGTLEELPALIRGATATTTTAPSRTSRSASATPTVSPSSAPP